MYSQETEQRQYPEPQARLSLPSPNFKFLNRNPDRNHECSGRNPHGQFFLSWPNLQKGTQFALKALTLHHQKTNKKKNKKS